MVDMVSEDNGLLSIEQVERRVQEQTRAKRTRDRRAELIYPFLAGIGLLIVWELGTRVLNIPIYLFPPPSAVIVSAVKNWELLLRESWITSVEILAGYAVSIAVGIPLAFAIFRWPVFSKSIYPLLISSQAMPKVAVAPLFVVWFGFGLFPKVLIAFLIAFFPIVINTVMGLASIEREKIYLAQSMGLSSFETFRLIRLPNALPSIFAGLKISITLAVVGAVVGEFVGGDGGLGYQLMVANGSMDTPLLFAGIAALTVLGVLFYWIVEVVERLSMPHLERSPDIAGSV
ncbi:MAG: ABC transporter permease [Rhizobiales bacterium]|jgi:NitT/TauT family transport system permease protein|nr:ABC transporter permease [Hyphomicrobiales bacterium]